MTFAVRLCMGNSFWFSKCQNKVMNVEIKFTYLNMGLSLCFVCNLGAFRGRSRRVFGSVVRGVVSPLKVAKQHRKQHRTKNSPKTA